MIKRNLISCSWAWSCNSEIFQYFLKWMCSTKILLKSFVHSNNPWTSTCLLFIILLNKQWSFPKCPKFMDLLGVIVPASISKKSFFVSLTKKQKDDMVKPFSHFQITINRLESNSPLEQLLSLLTDSLENLILHNCTL